MRDFVNVINFLLSCIVISQQDINGIDFGAICWDWFLAYFVICLYKFSCVFERHAGSTVFFFFFFFFFRGAPEAYGSSQARGSIQSCTCHPMSQPQQWRIQAAMTNTTANAGSLTHWVRPGIKPLSSRMLQVHYLWATTGTPPQSINVH